MIGEKRIVCGCSVRWWDEELREMVIDRRACHKQVMEGNKEAWSEYCMKRKLLKEKIREKRIKNESYMQSINESYKKNKNEFWKFVHSKQSNSSRKKIQLLRDDT